MRSASCLGTVSAAACSTMPYPGALPPVALPATVTPRKQIVPRHHGGEPRAQAVREPRLVERAHSDEHGLGRSDGVETDDRQIAEPPRRRTIDGARAHQVPGARGVAAQEPGGFARAETHGRGRHALEQTVVEVTPRGEILRAPAGVDRNESR